MSLTVTVRANRAFKNFTDNFEGKLIYIISSSYQKKKGNLNFYFSNVVLCRFLSYNAVSHPRYNFGS